MPIDLRYVPYCHPEFAFYTPIDNAPSARLDSNVVIPSSWEIINGQPWTHAKPRNVDLPRQGWKVHVSATLANREHVLETVATFCVDREISFKYLSTHADYLALNGKYTNRGSAGKFVTIYPCDIDQFEDTLLGLEDCIGAEEGPYILSDRKWGSGPVFYRYGAFLPPEQPTQFESTLIDPHGNVVEDVRRPIFTLPSWVEEPAFVKERKQNAAIDAQFPFDMKTALHFSAGGGVYVAEANSSEYVPEGTRVVLKEARPFAALDTEGKDAVARLRHEHRVLCELAHTSYVPRTYALFKAWDNLYLVMDYVDGSSLKRETMLRTPVLKPAPWKLEDAAFNTWLTGVVQETDKAVQAFHEAGWLLGDIHPKNIVLEGGTRPVFIDFEFAHPVDPDWRIGQVAPGYGPRKGLSGSDADLWSLGITQLDMVLPQATTADQGNEGLIYRLLDEADQELSLPASVSHSISQKLPTDDDGGEQQMLQAAPLDTVLNLLVSGVERHIRFTDDSPALPGDIELFGRGGVEAALSYPYGIAGALAVTAKAGRPLDQRYVELSVPWIEKNLSHVSTPGFRGRDGLDYGLRQAGMRELALEVSSLSVADPVDPTYWSGWAGLGLNALSSNETDTALRASAGLRRMLRDGYTTESAGLLYGWSGAAIFWSELYKRSDQEGELVDLAKEAIDRELRRCSLTQNGTVEYDEGWRTLPYLGTGSCGIALAIHELRAATGTDLYEDEYRKLIRACTYYQCAQGTYGYGLAGFATVLNRAKASLSPDAAMALKKAPDTLRLFLVPRDGSAFVRGNQGLKLSCDFLTGSLGVVAALSALRGDWSGVPFLPGGGNDTNEREEVY